jgi:hypothetical protein
VRGLQALADVGEAGGEGMELGHVECLTDLDTLV